MLSITTDTAGVSHTCDKTLTTKTGVRNEGSQDVTYTDSVSWEASETSTTSWEMTLSTSVTIETSASLIFGDSSYSISIGYDFTKGGEVSKTTTYS